MESHHAVILSAAKDLLVRTVNKTGPSASPQDGIGFAGWVGFINPAMS